jgi:hypothetical protein
MKRILKFDEFNKNVLQLYIIAPNLDRGWDLPATPFTTSLLSSSMKVLEKPKFLNQIII